MTTLKSLAYTNNENILSISPSIPKEYRNFFSGGWLEAVNRYLIRRTLDAYSNERNISHKIFWNVCLKKKGATNNNSNDVELDIVVEINDRIYIFETKAGQTLCIDKWIDRARLFTCPNCHFITCCMDETINPNNFKPYKLFVLQTLEQQFTELLKKDFPPPPLQT